MKSLPISSCPALQWLECVVHNIGSRFISLPVYSFGSGIPEAEYMLSMKPAICTTSLCHTALFPKMTYPIWQTRTKSTWDIQITFGHYPWGNGAGDGRLGILSQHSIHPVLSFFCVIEIHSVLYIYSIFVLEAMLGLAADLSKLLKEYLFNSHLDNTRISIAMK